MWNRRSPEEWMKTVAKLTDPTGIGILSGISDVTTAFSGTDIDRLDAGIAIAKKQRQLRDNVTKYAKMEEQAMIDSTDYETQARGRIARQRREMVGKGEMSDT